MDMTARTLETDARLRRTVGLVKGTTPYSTTARTHYDSRWDWVVRSYTQAGSFRMETVHQGDHSMFLEVKACRSLGRDVDVFRLVQGDRLRHPEFFGGVRFRVGGRR